MSTAISSNKQCQAIFKDGVLRRLSISRLRFRKVPLRGDKFLPPEFLILNLPGAIENNERKQVHHQDLGKQKNGRLREQIHTWPHRRRTSLSILFHAKIQQSRLPKSNRVRSLTFATCPIPNGMKIDWRIEKPVIKLSLLSLVSNMCFAVHAEIR